MLEQKAGVRGSTVDGSASLGEGMGGCELAVEREAMFRERWAEWSKAVGRKEAPPPLGQFLDIISGSIGCPCSRCPDRRRLADRRGTDPERGSAHRRW